MTVLLWILASIAMYIAPSILLYRLSYVYFFEKELRHTQANYPSLYPGEAAFKRADDCAKFSAGMIAGFWPFTCAPVLIMMYATPTPPSVALKQEQERTKQAEALAEKRRVDFEKLEVEAGLRQPESLELSRKRWGK